MRCGANGFLINPQVGTATIAAPFTASGNAVLAGAASTLGFYNATGIAKPTITGDRQGNAALADLLTDLASQGLITNSTTAGVVPGSSITHGEIYLSGGTTNQTTNTTADTFDVITVWASNGESNGTTPDQANNVITLDEAGTYLVGFSVSFSGTVQATFECRAYVNGVAQTQCSLERKLGTGGDVGSASFQGIVTATAGQDLDVRVAADTGSDTFTPSEMNLTVLRIDS